MKNNKGFTLVEVLSSLVIITLIIIVVLNISHNTFSISKEQAYEIMKNNIHKASENYIRECESKQLHCNLNWNNNRTEFYVVKLKEYGYFTTLRSPIDGKDIGKCLLIEVEKNNGTLDIELIDNCY